MAAGECVLVFPGGAREVAKRKGEAYRLKWGERLGFVRMAVQHGCTIVPFSALGADDAYDILLDGDDLMASPLGVVLSRFGVRSDTLLPVALGWGGTAIPKPERLYFKFGESLDMSPFRGREDDDALCLEIRSQVAQAIEGGINDLKSFREEDPKRSLSSRLKAALGV
jgi:1-acyl-sn-glycerol-3-phosphate acyltransferase